MTVVDARELADEVARCGPHLHSGQAMAKAGALAAGNQTVVDRVAELILPLLPQRVMDD